MRILIIRTFPNELKIQNYNVQEIGLAKALVKKGHHCGIVMFSSNKKDTIEYIGKSITIYKLHGFGILKNGFFPSLNKIVKEYDVLQVHEYDQITSWYYYALYRKKPVVIYHGPYYCQFNKGYNFKCKVFDNTFLKIGRNRDTICLTKSGLAAEFLKTKGFQKCIPVGVGIDTDAFQIKEENVVERDDSFRLLYIGKIEERRNVFFLLDVVSGLLNKKLDIKLTIIGDGDNEYVKTFQKKAKPYIDNGIITLIQKVEQTDIKKFFDNADLMVFPTNYDIFGMVLLEAMFFSLPVVSSLNGGANMLIENGKNGYIVSELELQKWINTISSIITDKDKFQIVQQNLQNIKREKLTWDYLSNTFIAVYQEAILQKR